MRYRMGASTGEITSLPGCATVAVSHGVYVAPKDRGQGHGKAMNAGRLHMARDVGYEYMMCTVRVANVAQQKVLEHNGWKHLDTFWSNRSGDGIQVWGIALYVQEGR